jgi:hypothetical protein
VLFFLLKLVFGGCIASPAPFLGFCRRFLYNPQLLTLRFIHHPEVTARCSVRTVHIQGAMHPIFLEGHFFLRNDKSMRRSVLQR